MTNRIQPKQVLQDADIPVVSSFGGLSTASVNTSADPIYFEKLINAYVNSGGAVQKRSGSLVNSSVAWYDGRFGYGIHRFKFDGVFYLMVKLSDTVVMLASVDGLNYTIVWQRAGIFGGRALDEKPTFATKVENNFCHVFIATASNQLIDVVLVKSTINNVSISGSTASGAIVPGILGANRITSTNSLLKYKGAIFTASSVTHTDASVAAYTGTNINTVPNGSLVDIHTFFWTRCADAIYYPGSYLVNSAIRRNSLPLDVNIALPDDIVSQPIINEPTQNLAIASMVVYANAVAQTKVNRNPANQFEWDFSDGSYYTGVGLLTNRTPSFISFGGLIGGGQNTTISMARLRRQLIGNTIANTQVFVDKTLTSATYHDINGNTIISGVPYYFSFLGANPNINLSSVVELIDTTNYAGSGATASIVNLEAVAFDSVQVGDGWCLPLYGYNYVIKNKSNFPPIVSVVGNRLILTGNDSRIVFSSADWMYRGCTFNNIQLSTINFGSASAFAINMTQGSSEVRAVTVVNGVVVVGTDTGIFRISGSSVNTPATAEAAVVSRLSNEILPNNNCFALFDNKVYYVSRTGMYELEFSEERGELANRSMSTMIRVTDFATVNAMSYVESIRSFLISFSNTNKLLALNVDTASFWILKFATSLTPIVERGFDGFFFIVPSNDPLENALLSCVFTDTQANDLANLGGWFAYALPGRSVTVGVNPTNVDALVVPAELVKLVTPTAPVVVTTGDNNLRCYGTDTLVTIQEYPSSTAPLPVWSYMVTKAFTSDRLDRANRIRGVSVLSTGTGFLGVRFGMVGDAYADRADEVLVYTIGAPTYTGELLLNAAIPQYVVRGYEGNTINTKIRTAGIREAWNLAMQITTGLGLIGLQFDTSVKSRKRLK